MRKFRSTADTIMCMGLMTAFMIGPVSGQDSSRTQIQYEHRFGGLDLPAEQMFAAPTDLAVGSKDRVYVLDSRDSNIKVFSMDGKFLTTFGREGAGPGGPHLPHRFRRKRPALCPGCGIPLRLPVRARLNEHQRGPNRLPAGAFINFEEVDFL